MKSAHRSPPSWMLRWPKRGLTCMEPRRRRWGVCGQAGVQDSGAARARQVRCVAHCAHQSQQQSSTASCPRGTAWTPQAVRQRMVQKLAGQGVTDPLVLGAMGAIERHRFVDSALVNQAYEDTSLPIGLGQTISKPGVVSRMIELLRNGATGRLGRVLEIGTGCGYQAAVLSLVAHEVYSIERLRGLHDKARDNLRHLRLPNVHLLFGDGMVSRARIWVALIRLREDQAGDPASVRSRPNSLQQLNAIHPRQTNVRHQDVRVSLGNMLERFVGGTDTGNPDDQGPSSPGESGKDRRDCRQQQE